MNSCLRETKKEVAKLPHETKQKILDLMYMGHTIGEVRKSLNLDLMVVCGVINENMESTLSINRLAK